MRVATRRNVSRSRVAQDYPQPAPTLGWNARDGIANMKVGYAYRMDNWFPTASNIELRKGSAAHVTGITGEVETLETYKPETGSQSMWGWANSSIYNVTAAGAVGAAAVSGLSNNRWQVTNMSTTGGNFLLCVNGADNMRLYDGSAWTAITAVSTPAITGIATTSLVHVHVFKERAFYIEKDSLSVWYAAAGAFAGALTELPLQAVFKKGGYLVAMGSWTLDGGSGMDDYAVFVTSEGEAAVYQGTNPASASTWALVGVYNIGKPIGRRCMLKFGGDLLIITTDGVVPASRAFVKARSEGTAVAITDIIQGAMAGSVKLYSAEFGWELTLYSEGPALILNVPNTNGQQQYVMNTYTKAWCRFTGWEANCFAELNGSLYYGGNTFVRKAWTGPADLGVAITGDVITAFNYFGDRSSFKFMTMMQPIFGWDAAPSSLLVGVNADFETSDPTSEITLPSASGSTWDSGLWDSAVWGGEAEVKNSWYTAVGTGYAIALHIKVTSSLAESFTFSAVNYLYQRGSPL